ncbi:hypothetical protein BT96DRAFT_949186 [Gymnopus androsaceus JB14]|uniref:Uncharacterized protein n=1 Tax=Gymnopus androsaceus JB14 TaxID=1447944 RepID=A0A6A4GM24_9AGAR|nr:hypothetical protein BT96DRAFT_949186 [Gymnopus androsaceus JB14]
MMDPDLLTNEMLAEEWDIFSSSLTGYARLEPSKTKISDIRLTTAELEYRGVARRGAIEFLSPSKLVPKIRAVCFLTYHLIAPPTASLFSTLAGTSPLVPGLRDTFKVWRERLQAGVEAPELALFLLHNDGYSYYRSDKEDDTLLAHIAPLAKIYGFELDIVQVDQCQESIHTIGHAYRDLDALHEDMDVNLRLLTWKKGQGFTTNDIVFWDIFSHSSRDDHSDRVFTAIEDAIACDGYISHHGDVKDQEPRREVEGLEEGRPRITKTRNLQFANLVSLGLYSNPSNEAKSNEAKSEECTSKSNYYRTIIEY